MPDFNTLSPLWQLLIIIFGVLGAVFFFFAIFWHQGKQVFKTCPKCDKKTLCVSRFFYKKIPQKIAKFCCDCGENLSPEKCFCLKGSYSSSEQKNYIL